MKSSISKSIRSSIISSSKSSIIRSSIIISIRSSISKSLSKRISSSISSSITEQIAQFSIELGNEISWRVNEVAVSLPACLPACLPVKLTWLYKQGSVLCKLAKTWQWRALSTRLTSQLNSRSAFPCPLILIRQTVDFKTFRVSHINVKVAIRYDHYSWLNPTWKSYR